MNVSDKDLSQDRLIEQNAERIARNEEAIKRQTAALEQIRDHYYPPPEGWFRRLMGWGGKIVCVIVAYLGIAEAVDWMWNTRVSENLAAEYAQVGRQLFYGEGNSSGAAACLKKAIELDEGEPDYRMALSIMHGMGLCSDLFDLERPLTDDEAERVNAALTEATVLAKQDPENPMPHVLLAQSHALRHEKDAALAAIVDALVCAPANAYVHVSACAVYFMCGEVAEARRQLAEAERLDASLPLIASWKGLFALLVDHDGAAARAAFQTCVKRAPRLAVSHAWLGRALLAGKDADVAAAKASFACALALDSRQKVALLGMAEICEHEGKLRTARIWQDRLLKNDEHNLTAYLARARVNDRLGETEAAIADLASAITLAPFRADLYRRRADLYEKSGNAAAAKTDRETATELE